MHQQRLDVIFAGFGASACLLALELHRKGWLKGKQIAILEPSSKDFNDRTFCFWAEPQAEIAGEFQSVISGSWDQVNMDGRVQSIAPMQYHHIRGVDLYSMTRQALRIYQPVWIREKVLEVSDAADGITCRCENTSYTGSVCFDSRPPGPWKAELPDVALLQSFFGLRIKMNGSAMLAHHATLMDFDVDQDGQTQFLYRLPFSNGEALIELTRFGEQALDASQAKLHVMKWIDVNIGEAEILETEYGVIPMDHGRPPETPVSDRHILLGTKAGMVKPSTGYAFRNMHQHAKVVADKLCNTSPLQTVKKSLRFSFYDHLLLIILRLWPETGQKIFRRLLNSTSASTVLRFLDEKTGWSEEINIFRKLPILVFIKALLFREWKTLTRHKIEWMVLLGVLTMVGLNALLPSVGIPLMWSIIIAGLIAVGIPHGALDDLLETGGLRNITIRFIAVYLTQAFAVLAWWWFHPPTALLFFLLYSAWHFGQADITENAGHSNARTVQGLIHGMMVLTIVLLSHVTELNNILQELGIAPVSPTLSILPVWLVSAGVLSSVLSGKRRLLLCYITLMATMMLPLLPAFGIYFIFQHSIRGWQHIRSRFGYSSVKLFRLALPFHIGAWLILGLLFLIKNEFRFPETITGPIGLFFVFLSALSFPHVIAMHRFYSTQKPA